jgi:hypothetical protein
VFVLCSLRYSRDGCLSPWLPPSVPVPYLLPYCSYYASGIISGCNDIGVDRANFDLIFSAFSVLDDDAVMRKQLHEAREQLMRQR